MHFRKQEMHFSGFSVLDHVDFISCSENNKPLECFHTLWWIWLLASSCPAMNMNDIKMPEMFNKLKLPLHEPRDTIGLM